MKKENRLCGAPDCGSPAVSLGYCNKHYHQFKRGQEFFNQRPSEDERFWAKVDKCEPHECWEWTASRTSKGYGDFWGKDRYHYAHRWSYMHHKGGIPDGLVIDHKCWNPLCVNPDHLQAVPQYINMQNRSALQRNNTTGARGVWWSKSINRYVAEGSIKGKKYHIGQFASLSDADAAARKWRLDNYVNSIADQVPH